MTDVFLSYSSKDRERVRSIRDMLVASGFDVFWDQEVPLGHNWDEWLRKHLTASHCVVVIWSANSIKSDNVIHEALVAKHLGKLIPILIDQLAPTDFPIGHFTAQGISVDGEGFTAVQLERLKTAVQRYIRSASVEAKQNLFNPTSYSDQGSATGNHIKKEKIDLSANINLRIPATSKNSLKIVCDAGGTSVRFALASDQHGIIHRKKYRVLDFPGGSDGFSASLVCFLHERDVIPIVPQIKSIIASGAGPTSGDDIRFTNTDWIVKKTTILEKVQSLIGPDVHVALLNDFEAVAYGLALLDTDDLEPIWPGDSAGPMRIVCGPGTGLGLAGLRQIGPNPSDVVAIATEAGHQSFAPETKVEHEIVSFFSERDADRNLNDPITYENILSGDGLRLLYEFFTQQLDATVPAESSPEQIVAEYYKNNLIAKNALEAFGFILGSFCGNMILALGATGGVYLWGGILKEFPSNILRNNIRERLRKKSRQADYVTKVPIYRIINNETALKGCSLFSMRNFGDG